MSKGYFCHQNKRYFEEKGGTCRQQMASQPCLWRGVCLRAEVGVSGGGGRAWSSALQPQPRSSMPRGLGCLPGDCGARPAHRKSLMPQTAEAMEPGTPAEQGPGVGGERDTKLHKDTDSRQEVGFKGPRRTKEETTGARSRDLTWDLSPGLVWVWPVCRGHRDGHCLGTAQGHPFGRVLIVHGQSLDRLLADGRHWTLCGHHTG